MDWKSSSKVLSWIIFNLKYTAYKVIEFPVSMLNNTVIINHLESGTYLYSALYFPKSLHLHHLNSITSLSIT